MYLYPLACSSPAPWLSVRSGGCFAVISFTRACNDVRLLLFSLIFSEKFLYIIAEKVCFLVLHSCFVLFYICPILQDPFLYGKVFFYIEKILIFTNIFKPYHATNCNYFSDFARSSNGCGRSGCPFSLSSVILPLHSPCYGRFFQRF